MSKLTYQHRFLTPKRLNWVELFEPKAVQMPGADPSKKMYQVEWILETDDPDLGKIITEARNILSQVAGERGISDLKTVRTYQDFNWPIMTGERFVERAKQRATRRGKTYVDWEDHLLGKMVLNSRAYESDFGPPQLYGIENGKFVHYADPMLRAQQRSKFYRGVDAMGLVSIVGFNISDKSWGISCFVNEVASLNRGERIGSRVSDASEYGEPPEAF